MKTVEMKPKSRSVSSPDNERAASKLSDASFPELLHEVLLRIGEDPSRDGLQRTPERMEKALKFLTKGHSENPEEILRGAMFDVDYDEMVIVRDIEMFSLCEHHLLPF